MSIVNVPSVLRLLLVAFVYHVISGGGLLYTKHLCITIFLDADTIQSSVSQLTRGLSEKQQRSETREEGVTRLVVNEREA